VLDIEDLNKLECNGRPGIGSCSGMFTANTMASIIASMGLALPHTICTPAFEWDGDHHVVHPQQWQNCVDTVDYLLKYIERFNTKH